MIDRSLLGEIGSFYGIPLVQCADVPYGKAIVLSESGPVVVLDMTRPSLRFPLTEALANQEPKIDLWYFDRKKWPHRIVQEAFREH